jgi:chaperonin GroES
VIDLPEFWNSISQSLPPYFLGTLTAAAFGAFAGAWINNRIQAKKAAVAELNSVSSAMLFCISICNRSIGFKRQFVVPMRDAYERVRKEYDQRTPADRVPRADLQTLMPPKMPTEVLERHVFEKISIRGRALAAAVQLVGSIDGLAKAIEFRNDLISEFRDTSPDQRLIKYLGLRSTEGVVDERYHSVIVGIYEQADECIFFSRILAEDLLKYGERLRRRHLRGLRLGLPKFDGADWSNVENSGLMPSADLYKAWLNGFRPVPSIWQRLIGWLRSFFRKARTRKGAMKPSLSDANVTAAKSEFRPLRDGVLVRPVDVEQMTPGGIIIPDVARNKPQQGHVLAVGPGVRDKRGRPIPIDLEIGDKILFGKGAGIEITFGGENLVIVREYDVVGVTRSC